MENLKNRVEDKVSEVLAIAREVCPHLRKPEIKYNVKGRNGGECVVWPDGRCILRFNSKFLKEDPDEFVNVIVPHELAHYVTHIIYGKVAPHGKEWQEIMNLFGIENSGRCHSFSTDEPDAMYPWVYECRCDLHFLSSKRHGLVKRGREYTCKKCGSCITFVKKA